MRIKVIDTNALNEPLLIHYLSKRRENYVILTDYVAMEMYLSSGIGGLLKRVEVLERFLPQVLVAKSTYDVCADRGRQAGLRRRLIDSVQTEGLPKFIESIRKGMTGDPNKITAYSQHHSAAQTETQRMLIGSEDVISGMTAIYEELSDRDLNVIRGDKVLNSELSNKILAKITDLTIAFFRSHPHVQKIPRTTDIVHTYLFRVALTVHCYMLERFKDGLSPGLSAKKVRNDMIDVYLVAYGTLFDGLLTTDKRAITVSANARLWLARFNANGF